MNNRNEALKPLRVLLVDDSEEMRAIFRCLLESIQGVSPAESPDAPDALQKVTVAQKEGLPFSLILLDIRMPGVNGVEAAKALRQSGYKGVIAACTAVATGAGRNDALGAGIDVYLDKRHVKKDTIQALLIQARERAL